MFVGLGVCSIVFSPLSWVCLFVVILTIPLLYLFYCNPVIFLKRYSLLKKKADEMEWWVGWGYKNKALSGLIHLIQLR
jgi:hypothetical protein